MINCGVESFFNSLSTLQPGYMVTRSEMHEVTGTGSHLATSTTPRTGRGYNYSGNIHAVENPSQVLEEFGFDETKVVDKKFTFSEDSNDSTFTSSRPLAHVGTGGGVGGGNSGLNERWSSGDESFSVSRASGSDYEGKDSILRFRLGGFSLIGLRIDWMYQS